MSALSLSRRAVMAGLAVAPVLGASVQGAAAARWRRGINLSHLQTWPQMADASTYVWPPYREPRYQISPATLSGLKATGFDFVRLPVDPAPWLSETASERRRVLADRLLGHVRACLGAGLNVVVDLHASTQNPVFQPGPLAGAGPDGQQLFQRYRAVVGDVAAVLARLPVSAVAFEPMNEPALTDPGDIAAWPGRMRSLVDAARARAPRLTVISGGANYGHAADLLRLDPATFADCAFTFHSYEPFTFTHQSAAKVVALRRLVGVPWPAAAGSPEQTLAACRAGMEAEGLDAAGRAQAEPALRRLIDSYFRKDWSAADIARQFAAVADWARAGGRRPNEVLLGEFGCGRTLGDQVRAATPDRLRWLTTMRAEAERQGFGWAIWAYTAQEFTLAGPDGVLDPETLDALGLPAG